MIFCGFCLNEHRPSQLIMALAPKNACICHTCLARLYHGWIGWLEGKDAIIEQPKEPVT
jgi:hypothetical protein